MTVVVVLLIVQNRELKSKPTEPANSTGALSVGDRVPAVSVKTLDGNEVVIGGQDSTSYHLLFVFTTTCPFCEKNWETWENLSSICSSGDVKPLGLSLHSSEKTSKFMKSRRGTFSVFTADSLFARAYKIGGVPVTILLRGDGRVEGRWLGLLGSDQLDDIMENLASHAVDHSQM